MNPPGVLAYRLNASRAASGGRKVHMRQLGDRVTQRIIADSQRPVATVHVGDDPAGDMSRRRGGESLDPIADDQDDIGVDSIEDGSQFGLSAASGDCNRKLRIFFGN